MKRPLGVIGLTFLVTLAVIFHCYSTLLVILTAAGAAAAAAAAVLCRVIRHNTRIHLTVAAAALSVTAALLALFLFHCFSVQPIVSQYAGKTIRAEGYIGDTVRIKDSCVTYVIHTETIDGKPCRTKIGFTVFDTYDLYPFDKVAVTLTPQETEYTNSLSKGIFLYAFEEENADVTALEERHTSLYTKVVSLRRIMTGTLDRCLDSDAADVAKAVLLGEKHALPDNIYQAFADTGASYLIVVSGMHLAIVTFLLRKCFDRLKRLWTQITFAVLSALFILLYMALTGFTPSVTRAGFMLMITYLAKLFFREADIFTSLGIAALILTVPNPYAVGDVGLLLSFAATFGIALWADPMTAFCVQKLRLTGVKPLRLEQTRGGKIKNLLKRPPRWVISFFCVSVAATLWVMPTTVFFFGRLTPLTPLISLVAYPLIVAILLLSFALVVLPFAGAVLAPLINRLTELLLAWMERCSTLPFCSVPANKPFVFIWLAVSAVLVIVGYMIRGKKLYVFSAVFIAVQTLLIGGAVSTLFADHTAELTLYRFGSGYTAMVRKDDNVSLLSCGGAKRGQTVVADALSPFSQVDNLIVADKQQRYLAYLPLILEEKPVSNLFLYEKASQDTALPEEASSIFFHDSSQFTVRLNSDVSVTVFCAGNRVFRYVFSDRFSVLIMPPYSDAAQLPEELRRADVLLLEGKADAANISADRVISLTGESDGETPEDGEVLTFRF